MLPPAPPPPPPPSWAGGGSWGPPKANASGASGAGSDRNALLSQIRSGAKLKKTITNDRSAPLIGNKSSNSSASAPTAGNNNSASPLALGGLFSGGIPKLKATGRAAALGVSSSAETSASPPAKDLSPPRLSNLQQPGAGFSGRPAKLGEVPTSSTAIRNIASNSNGSPERNRPTSGDATSSATQVFPCDISTPQLLLSHSQSKNVGNSCRPGPPLPSKPPAATTASSGNAPARQDRMSGGGPHASTGKPAATRPTHKPPPPPKGSAAKFGTIGSHVKRNASGLSATPAGLTPASSSMVQHVHLTRRQSLGAGDASTAMLNTIMTNCSNAPPLSLASATNASSKPQSTPPPPPPPRNMSVPSNMHTLHRHPPPVPPPTAIITHKKGGGVSAAPLAPPLTKPPPPPPNKTLTLRTGTSTAGSHLHAGGSLNCGDATCGGSFGQSTGNTSTSSIESRFAFHNINDLSASYEPTPVKSYPSRKAKRPHQRRAPAPPSAAALVS